MVMQELNRGGHCPLGPPRCANVEMLYHLFGTEKVLKNRPASDKTCGAVWIFACG